MRRVLDYLGGMCNGTGCIDGVQGGEFTANDFCCLVYDDAVVWIWRVDQLSRTRQLLRR